MPPTAAEIVKIAREVREINRALDAHRRVIEAKVAECTQLLDRRKPLDFALREVPPRFLRAALKEEDDAAHIEIRGGSPAMDESPPVGVPAQGDVLQSQERPQAPAPAHGDI